MVAPRYPRLSREAGRPNEVHPMTERNSDMTIEDPRDPKDEPAGAHAGTGAGDRARSEGVGTESGGPDAERDQSGLGSEAASGRGGWQGSDPAQSEIGGLGRGETGSMGSGGSAASQSTSGETAWKEQSAGQTGGAQGQDAIEGEGWEGRDRDTGGGGWTTGDAGFGSSTADDGGPNPGDGNDRNDDRPDLS
jgi:hypothetical protein